MILEALVTSLNEDGSLNVAPMGPRVDEGFQRFLLRPFQTSTTYQNLVRHPEGVLHVTDDVLMIARAAIGLRSIAESRQASQVNGRVILGACRYYEFIVTDIDATDDRVSIVCETVASGLLREFFGFNRAKHAVLEAAILATRIGILPMETIAADLCRLASPVEKTGGPAELEAFRLLVDHVRNVGQSNLELPRL
jgi:hypothetical protein